MQLSGMPQNAERLSMWRTRSVRGVEAMGSVSSKRVAFYCRRKYLAKIQIKH